MSGRYRKTGWTGQCDAVRWRENRDGCKRSRENCSSKRAYGDAEEGAEGRLLPLLTIPSSFSKVNLDDSLEHSSRLVLRRQTTAFRV